MIATVRTKIKEVLETVSDLHIVYDYEVGNVDKYPYATVTLASGDIEFADSSAAAIGRNFNTISFAVNIFIEREATVSGSEKAERILLETVDAVLVALQNNTTLDDTVLWQKPVSYETDYDIRELTLRTCTIIVECKTINSSQ